MKKTKVLFLLEAFDKGGIEKVTLDIVNHLDPEKYDITVQTFWYGGHCQSQVTDHVKVIPFFFKRYVRGIIRLIEYLSPRMLYKLFIHGDYDVEIAASDGGAAKVISGSSNHHSKKICWVHMDVMERGSKLKEFTNAESASTIYSKFDLIVPVSEACKDRFCQKFGECYPMRVVRNPMPIEEILEKSTEYVPEMHQGKFNIVCVGRLVEQKGFDRLLEAVRQVKENSNKPFHINIIGEGPMRKQLQVLIDQYQLNNVVALLGYCDNPYPYIKQADAFLLSSRDESFSLVVGESLILGTPVVATDCSGVREWLNEERYGLITINSTEGIIEGLLQILENDILLDNYREKMVEIKDKLSFDQALKEFEDILR